VVAWSLHPRIESAAFAFFQARRTGQADYRYLPEGAQLHGWFSRHRKSPMKSPAKQKFNATWPRYRESFCQLVPNRVAPSTPFASASARRHWLRLFSKTAVTLYLDTQRLGRRGPFCRISVTPRKARCHLSYTALPTMPSHSIRQSGLELQRCHRVLSWRPRVRQHQISTTVLFLSLRSLSIACITIEPSPNVGSMHLLA
jgi:hypothetical protein